MIHVLCVGRLGNHMFRYAFARKMQIERGDKIVMHFRKKDIMSGLENSGNQIKHFRLQDNLEFSSENNILHYMSFVQKALYLSFICLRKISLKNYYIYNKIQKIAIPYLNKFGLFMQSIDYFQNTMSNLSDIFIHGGYECAKYFSDIDDLLREEFTPIYPPLIQNRELYSIIGNTESVCVSIRRGDFLSSKYKSLYNICTLKYFENSIIKMKKLHPTAVFIFFSDDILWCREVFKKKSNNYYFESGIDPVWEKLRCMYSCKHFIISNSTFSWWAQHLSRNANKTVIAPEYWLNLTCFEAPLLENSFIKISID